MALDKRIIIYQLLPRLFGNKNTTRKPNGSIEDNGCGKLNDITEKQLLQIKQLGATHVWFTGVIRHATATSYASFDIPTQHAEIVKGKAGSPYAITDYYDIDPDLAVDVPHRMEEFENLLQRAHHLGLKVIIDFVPNHVAREYHSIAKPHGVRDLGETDDPSMHFSVENNFYYCWGQPFEPRFDAGSYKEMPARATGNDHFDNHPSRNDWYETVKLNYGIDYCDAGGKSEHFYPMPDTWGKMTDVLFYWASKGVDGFRCDMAEMVPSQFWTFAIGKLKATYPQLIFIGEVYNPMLYAQYLHAGFDYLYDKVGMYDCLRDVTCHRRPAADITRQWQSTNEMLHSMLYFLENHDEQRIASDFFAANAWKAVPALMVCAFLQTNPLMIYNGQEFGESGMDEEGFSGRDGRTTIFDYWSVESVRRGFFDRRRMTADARRIEKTVRHILQLSNNESVLREGAFFDLMYVNLPLASRQYAFLRKDASAVALVVVNFDDKPVSIDVNLPQHAFDFLSIPQGTFSATELMSEQSVELTLSPNAPVTADIPSRSGCVYKIKL